MACVVVEFAWRSVPELKQSPPLRPRTGRPSARGARSGESRKATGAQPPPADRIPTHLGRLCTAPQTVLKTLRAPLEFRFRTIRAETQQSPHACHRPYPYRAGVSRRCAIKVRRRKKAVGLFDRGDARGKSRRELVRRRRWGSIAASRLTSSRIWSQPSSRPAKCGGRRGGVSNLEPP